MHPSLFLSFSLTVLSVCALPTTRDGPGFVVLPCKKQWQASGSNWNPQPLEASLTNQGIYSIDVTIGTPPQPISVVLDTGSSDVWFYAPESASTCTTCTSTYFNYRESTTEEPLYNLGVFNISYGSTQGVTGFYASDLLAVSGVSVRQIIGIATVAYKGSPPGGILGIGLSYNEAIVEYHGLAAAYPGYIDTLKNNGVIKTRAYSIFLNDRTPTDTTPGTIIFGGYDPTKWLGTLVAFPLIEPSPRGAYDLDIAFPAIDFVIDGQSFNVPPSAAYHTVLLDTGTAITRIPADQFAAIESILELKPQEAPFYYINCNAGSIQGGFEFTFFGPYGQVTIEVPWAELVFPNGDGTCIFGLAPAATDFPLAILGDTVLRSAYLLYNFDAGTISLAQASYDQSTGHAVSL